MSDKKITVGPLTEAEMSTFRDSMATDMHSKNVKGVVQHTLIDLMLRARCKHLNHSNISQSQETVV